MRECASLDGRRGQSRALQPLASAA
jgi:hypothetical protein